MLHVIPRRRLRSCVGRACEPFWVPRSSDKLGVALLIKKREVGRVAYWR